MKNTPSRRKIFALAGFVAALSLFAFSLVQGYWYQSNFSVDTADWVLLYKYSRNGYINNGTPSANMQAAGGYLRITGVVNDNSAFMDNWTGRTAYYNGATYSASKTAPFGVEFLREATTIDPHTGANGESERHSAAQGFWLVQGTPPDGSVVNETFANSVFMYEMMRMTYNVSGSPLHPRSTWGYYISSAQRFDLTQVKRPAGGTSDLTSDPTYTLEWNYDDNFGAGTQDTTGEANANFTRPYPVGIRLTHDGSRVRFYLNPDPTDANSYANEYHLVGSVGVSWNSGIRFMTGMETRRADGENHASDIKSVTVRSVANSVTAEVGPEKVAKGSVNNFNLVIAPTFVSTDAGIGELTIAKPAAYTGAWDPTKIEVYSFKGTGTNHTWHPTLKKMTYRADASFTADGQAYIFVENTTNLRIRFRQTSDANNGVIRGDTGGGAADRKIVVVMPFTAPAAANGVGDEFIVYADCVKYDGQAYSRWGTTGMIQASAGDASASIEGSSLKVKTYNNPDARSAIEPVETYVGATTVYLYVSTTNVNSPDISEIRVRIPDGYVISADNSSGNTYSSLIISADASYVTKISENGTNYIRVDYKGANTFLPASGGMDRISITVDSTPAGFSGATTNTVWQASVKSEIPGTARTVCRQDSAYNNMALLVRQLPPVMLASLSTIPEGTTNTLYNNNHYNQVTLAVQNNGGIGNLIKRIRIQMPVNVSAVDGLGSAVIGGGDSGLGISYNAGLNQLVIDYASQGRVLNPGQSDTIRFNIQDTVPSMSDSVIQSFPVAADNDNEEGFVAATEGTQTWRIRWKRPDAAGSASVSAANGLTLGATNRIYTSTTGATRVQFGINNTGGAYNTVRLVEITIPAQFTNIANGISSYYAAAPVEVIGNRVLVKYGEAGTGIPDGQSDTVSLDLKDGVGLTQGQEVEFAIRLGNTIWESNLKPTGLVPGANKKILFVRPPLLASVATLPVQINSDINTNLLTTTVINTGDPENIIGELRIHVPDTIASNILNTATSSVLGENSGASANISVDTTGFSNFVRIVYPPAKPFRGGMTETVTFSMVDHINGSTNFAVVTTASNARNQWQKLGTTSGGTNILTIRIPPAQGRLSLLPNVLYHHDGAVAVATNLLVLTLTNTGVGGNDITSAVVNFPLLMQNKITSVSNRSGAPLTKLDSQLKISIDYSSVKLQATKSDKVYIWLRTDMPSQTVDQPFTCTFDNGQGPQSATVPAGKSAALSLVTRPEIFVAQNDVTPNQIFTTDSFSTFVFTFKNGATGGKSISRLRIDVPDPFISTGAVLASPWPSSTEVINETNGRAVFVNYTTSKLDAGSSDEVSVGLRDNLVIGTTNVVFTAWADYGDGSGFKPVRVTTDKSMGIEFVFPDASAYASVTPRMVNMNTTSNQFTVIVTNTGVPGNHIRKLELDLGKYVTNVGVRSSSILGIGAGTIISNRYLLLDYAAALTNLPSGYKDTITVAAIDSVDEVTNVTVRIRVSNTTADAQYRQATEQTTGGLKISYFRPDYLGSAYVEALNRVSADKPNTVFSTVTTSTLRYTLVNDGAADNDLDAVRIYLPELYVNPASMAYITSQRGGVVDLAGSVLTVWYTNGTRLASTQRDTIQFAINDLVSSTNATSRWLSVSRFITSGGKFLTNQMVAGKSDSIHFEMPAPSARAKLRQRSLYASTRRFVTALDVTNSGSGSNAIETVRVTLPVGMRDGMSVAKVTNSFAASQVYSSGVITLTYTNFTVGRVDTIWLDLTNTYEDVWSGQLQVAVANRVMENSAVQWTTDALVQRVVTAPSVYAEAVSPRDGVDNRLWSTDYEAQYRVYVRNDGTGDAPVRRVRISLPAGFVVSAASSGAVGGTGLSFAGNTVSLDYPLAFPFTASQWDAITITAADPWAAGANTASFAVLVGGIDEIDGMDLNTNYAATRLYTGKSLTMSYVHPSVSTRYWIDGYAAGTKPFVYVAAKNSTRSTNVTIRLKNTGTSSNVIHRVRFEIPEVFSGISGITSTISNAVATVSGSLVEVSYPAEKLQAGASDTIGMTLVHAESDATNNLVFVARADNGDGNGFAVSQVENGAFSTMDIKYPPISVFAGIRNLTSLYTINTNATISYQVRNRAQGYAIFRTVLTNEGMALFDTLTATSSRGGVVTLEKPAGRLTIDYSGAGIGFNETDTVTMTLKYRITDDAVRTNSFGAIVFLTNATLLMQTNVRAAELDAIDTDTGSRDNQRYTIGPAPYGIFSGSVLPVFKTDKKSTGSFLPNIVKIELVTSSNNSVVTTPYYREVGSDGTMQSASLIAYSDPMAGGMFSLPYVPQGNFRLRLSADGFRLTLTNVQSVANQIRALDRVILKNDYLDSNITNRQIVVDYGDTNTRFILGSGTLLDQFSLDISVVDMTIGQETDVTRNRLVLAPADATVLGCFRFDIRDRLNVSVPGVGVGGDGIVQLHYMTTNLNLPIGAGTWQEDKLGIWYWKETTSEWVPVGGLVDTVKKTVSAKVNYLHNYYAVLSVRPEAAAQQIYNVKASPNPFTPGRGGDNSAKLKLTFSFSKEHPTYTVTIYNMRGQKIREFTRDGTYRQGEVFWDGRHENGFALPGGVYLYQIRAGGETFTGSVLVLK